MREETFLWHEAKYNYQRDVLLLRPHTSAGHTERGEEEKKKGSLWMEKRKQRSPGAKSSETSTASRLAVSQGPEVP